MAKTDFLEFIQTDLKRQVRPKWQVVVLALAPAAFAAAAGLLARGDFVEAFWPSNIAPAILSATLVTVGFWIFPFSSLSVKKKMFIFLLAASLSMASSLIQPQNEVSLAKFQDPSRFWPEAWHCLSLGLVIGLLGVVIFTWATVRFFPKLNRTARFALAFASGWSAAVALTFHCMGALRSHILIAHWGAALLVGLVSVFIHQRIFKIQIQRLLKEHTRSLRNLERLGS